MISKRKQLQKFSLYGVTALEDIQNTTFRKIEKALQGGVDIIQLRSKSLSDSELVKAGKKIRLLTKKYKKLFFVNDRPDLAHLLEADGIHIGQDDLSVREVRSLLKKGYLVGKSTHSLQQAKRTLAEDVDYIGFGPLYETPTKPNYKSTGMKLIKSVVRCASVPVVCIGGINSENIDEVLEAGASRVAIVRALFDAKDPKQVAAQLKKKLGEQR